jgi:hypothetical protein
MLLTEAGNCSEFDYGILRKDSPHQTFFKNAIKTSWALAATVEEVTCFGITVYPPARPCGRNKYKSSIQHATLCAIILSENCQAFFVMACTSGWP